MCDTYESYRYVGFNTCSEPYKEIFSAKVVKYIQDTVAVNLKGLRKDRRPTHVTQKTVQSVLQNVYQDTKYNVGGIGSRYVQPHASTRNDIQKIIDDTVDIITKYISNEYLTEENNKQLSIWDTVLGDLNKRGLRAHPPLKILEKKPLIMFNMKY